MNEAESLPPLPPPMRPKLLDFAMDFLGGQEAADLMAYITALELYATRACADRQNAIFAMRRICDLSDLEMRDGDEARNLAAKALDAIRSVK